MAIAECKRCKKERQVYAKDMCISCYNYTKYTIKNKDKVNKTNKKWRDKNKGYMKKYFEDNPDKYEEHKLRLRRYYHKNADRT
tara:strand:+ start:27 stop:275 length:249 start_codon:yes stop_codon:yes gene_type:complete